MNFIHKHRVFIFWLIQIVAFAGMYRWSPDWISTLVVSIFAGMLRSSPWGWWKTPLAHILGLLLGASHDHLWNVAEVVASIIGLPHPFFYLFSVVVITTFLVSITAQAIWLWMPYHKKVKS